jgi:hypothetical protein
MFIELTAAKRDFDMGADKKVWLNTAFVVMMESVPAGDNWPAHTLLLLEGGGSVRITAGPDSIVAMSKI